MIHRYFALFGLLLGLTTATLAAEFPSSTGFDQNVIDTLKNVHNQGADLYNTGDSSGCLRMYQGALQTIAPLLNHHPEIRQVIQEGLSDAAKLEGTRAQAFRLHELIEKVRAQLKEEVKKSSTAQPEPKKINPMPEPKKIDPIPLPKPKEPEPKKPEPKKPEPAPMPKPEPKKPEPAPMPKPESKKPEPAPMPKAPKTSSVMGKLTVDGKPAAEAEITFVTRGSAKPQVYTAKVTDGAYRFEKPLPAGEYAVMVAGSAKSRIADKFQTVQSSGLIVEVAGNTNSLDFDLKSK